jgi:hypothetical protein
MHRREEYYALHFEASALRSQWRVMEEVASPGRCECEDERGFGSRGTDRATDGWDVASTIHRGVARQFCLSAHFGLLPKADFASDLYGFFMNFLHKT